MIYFFFNTKYSKNSNISIDFIEKWHLSLYLNIMDLILWWDEMVSKSWRNHIINAFIETIKILFFLVSWTKIHGEFHLTKSIYYEEYIVILQVYGHQWNTYHSSVGRKWQYKSKVKYLRGKRRFIKSQFDASSDHKYMDEPSKYAYTIYTIIHNMNGRSRTGFFHSRTRQYWGWRVGGRGQTRHRTILHSLKIKK